jgi:hypothetical protein
MTNPMIRIHNQETNEVIDREMTDDEFAQFKANKAADAAEVKAEAQKAADKVGLLDKLGISEDEASLLLG